MQCCALRNNISVYVVPRLLLSECFQTLRLYKNAFFPHLLLVRRFMTVYTSSSSMVVRDSYVALGLCARARGRARNNAQTKLRMTQHKKKKNSAENKNSALGLMALWDKRSFIYATSISIFFALSASSGQIHTVPLLGLKVPFPGLKSIWAVEIISWMTLQLSLLVRTLSSSFALL